MKLAFASVFLLFFSVSLQVSAESWVGSKHCQPSLNACLKKKGGSTECGVEYEKCLKTSGGVLERSDGSMTQRYHPDNPQFKICQKKGLIIGTKAFDACMNGAGNTQTASTNPTPRSTTPAMTPMSSPVSNPIDVPTEPPIDTAAASACQAEFGQVYQKCEAESQVAVSTCDSNNDEEMTSFGNSAAEMALRVGQAAAITANCTEMIRVSQGANRTVAAYRERCKSAQTSCFNSCSQVTTFIAEKAKICFPHLSNEEAAAAMTQYQSVVSTNTRTCESLDTKIAEAGKAIQEYGDVLVGSTNCRADTYGGEDAGRLENLKMAAASSVDCADPNNATNRVCVCQKNPQDRTCTLSEQRAGESVAASSSDPSSRNPAQASGGLNGDMFGTPSITPGKPNSGEPGTVAEGRQGGEAFGGSGGSSGSASAGKGETASADGKEHGVLGGFYGGGSGGGSYGSYAGTGTGAAAQAGAQRIGGAASASSGELQKFLPGGQNGRRYPNGASGPDGITGPHSNIWLKIQNRYQNESTSLLP
ncbi:hypothetical protein [Bdellovibrio bacteriovorus]|uniref:hypothetical protein n=1 Tax=Bdellovibrio TaxID=958 RepID=UPI0035A92222